MNTYDLIFYIFALVIISSGLIVVLARNIVYSAFALLFTFFGVAGIYVLLSADFLAIVQIIIYVGGILILIIFGVMLTNKITNVEIKTESVQIIPATLIVGILSGLLLAALTKTEWRKTEPNLVDNTVTDIGRLLIGDYVLLFELAGIILLVALIGSVMIARKEKTTSSEAGQ